MSINTVLLSYHGLYSEGHNLSILTNRLEFDLETKGYKVAVAQTDYPMLGAISGIKPWNRKVVPLLMLESLAKYRYKYPGARIWVLCHSNGTLGISNALVEYFKHYGKGRYDPIRIDKLILFGSVVKRNFDWGVYGRIKVLNFVGSKDRVSSLARLWWAGSSGKSGFKIDTPNLTQYYTDWKHSDFVLPENYEYIRERIIG